ncbi:hypothetical protein C7121_00280 [Paenibacillus glucanolyticus]|uniref:hypothetical protein n=1 Tax=Paenibacillus TaxID=44249 RepID=UPI0003E220B1|nr:MULTISPECIES: hypothetical protein [Paenibacillus]ANA81188.1 hypothetical protein A3958_14920 [Paenibacillus glucanolyticus]AVV54695.1 hypothetical protein C7121_00280 [Paenibacillus glucanolyticus]ETT35963.1 hypothetical protein C169_15389 [Paenibacillus sp. FSL R5-808]MPY19026.1 hypothetical protein [Paenibacillus glucanolyticus]
MSLLQHAKQNAGFTMVWLAMGLIVMVLFVSGCGGDRMSYRETLTPSGKSLKGSTAEMHKDSPASSASFIEKLWGEVWDGVTHRTRQMTGEQVPQGRLLYDSGKRLEIRR